MDDFEQKDEGLSLLDLDDDSDLVEAAQALPSQIIDAESSSFGYDFDDCNKRLSAKPPSSEVSLDLFKHGRAGLSVTDLVNQFWCEQQFEYSFTKPIDKPVPEIVSTGSTIHLEKELEVHDLIPVVCETKEDAWALKFLNCYQQLTLLHQGSTIREFQIFGHLFNEEIFIQGIIDEICINQNGLLEIRELKTRSVKSMPRSSQHKKNSLQVSIYRKLLEDLLVKKTGMNVIEKHVMLDWECQLNQDVLSYAEELGLSCCTLGTTREILMAFLNLVTFPPFASPVIEYCYQNDKQIIGCLTCEYDEESLKKLLSKQYDFLLGKRQATGVDIEDAWKCNNCDYFDICSWRERREIACRKTNAVNFKL
eukprot:gene14346-15842_t